MVSTASAVDKLSEADPELDPLQLESNMGTRNVLMIKRIFNKFI